MLAAIADGTTRIKNYASSADCASTLSCLQKLGVTIERSGGEVAVHGAGARGLSHPESDLDCGNSGTTMRLLAGIIAGQNLTATLTGDESLCSRPMLRIIEPLQMMGAQIASQEGRAPLRVQGSPRLKSIEYKLPTASAQVKSCILLAGLNAAGKTTVVENDLTRDHTERMLGWFGAAIETGQAEGEERARFATVSGPTELSAQTLSIPGDISSAAYFIAAAMLLPDSAITINDVGINQTRSAFIDVLNAVGQIEIIDISDRANEPVGTIQVRGRQHLPLSDDSQTLSIAAAQIPRLIDELPLLAVVGSQLPGGMEIRDAQELRVKESDRISTTVAGLRAMGCEVEEYDDGLRVKGATKLSGARIDSHGDHRIAMSFAIAGLVAEGNTEIIGAECVAVSFPEFFELLDSVTER